MIRKLVPYMIILFLSFLTIQPLLSSGFFPMHDDTQVARVIVMAHALLHGQFPVRMVSDLGYGYGYPIFNFYGPLPYYVGGILHVLGLDALTATKLMIGIGVVIGSISIFLCSASIFGTLGGLFSMVLFTYFPYRAVQLYVRGAVGELWATAFLPLVLFGLLLVTQKDKRIKGVLIGSISLSAVILSHTVFGYIVTGAITFVAVVLFIVSFFWKKEMTRSLGISGILLTMFALGITAFFWLPAFTEMSYTNVGKVIGSSANLKDHFICPLQLWDSPWGFGGSAPGCLDGMSFKLGKLQIIYFIVPLFLWILAKEKGKRINTIMMMLTGLTVFLFFLMLPVSEAVWRYVPFSSFVQYPWRFLGLLSIGMALVCGYIFFRKKSVVSILIFILLAGSVVMVNLKLFSPQYIYEGSEQSFESKEDLRWRASKLSDEYLPKDLKLPETASQIVNDRVSGNEGVRVRTLSETETYGLYEIDADESKDLKLNMAYFPGWTYSIDGIPAKLNVVEGQPHVVLSSGISLLEIRFTDTVVRKVGNGISVLTVLGLIVVLVYGKKVIRNHRHTRIQ